MGGGGRGHAVAQGRVGWGRWVMGTAVPSARVDAERRASARASLRQRRLHSLQRDQAKAQLR